jgi:chromosome segregation ATPase
MDVGTPAAIARIRAVLRDDPSTEAELRALRLRADGWARALEGRVNARERRLAELNADAESSLAEIADVLREVEPLRRELADTLELIQRLDLRSRDLRSRWVSTGPAPRA